MVIWTLILLTLENNILWQSFNWPKPVHYVLIDKINASIRIRIRIRRILKVKIRIRRMRILTSFVTSLIISLSNSFARFIHWQVHSDLLRSSQRQHSLAGIFDLYIPVDGVRRSMIPPNECSTGPRSRTYELRRPLHRCPRPLAWVKLHTLDISLYIRSETNRRHFSSMRYNTWRRTFVAMCDPAL